MNPKQQGFGTLRPHFGDTLDIEPKDFSKAPKIIPIIQNPMCILSMACRGCTKGVLVPSKRLQVPFGLMRGLENLRVDMYPKGSQAKGVLVGLDREELHAFCQGFPANVLAILSQLASAKLLASSFRPKWARTNFTSSNTNPRSRRRISRLRWVASSLSSPQFLPNVMFPQAKERHQVRGWYIGTSSADQSLQPYYFFCSNFSSKTKTFMGYFGGPRSEGSLEPRTTRNPHSPPPQGRLQ